MKHFAVKVCGITRELDALFAASLGVDMIGLIFHSASPRYLTLPKAKRIAKILPITVDKVGVFVNHTISEVLGLSDALGLQYVQVHRVLKNSEIKLMHNNHLKVIQSSSISDTKNIANLYRFKSDVVLLDNRTSDTPGGTGKQFDWSIPLPKRIPNLMLAGGINAKNVAEGVKRFSPLIVDVNSGVESSPGIKSQSKLRLFMRECNRLRYGK